MRILLVRPPVPHHTIGLKNIMICEPLELEYVAAGLAGHEVEIFDGILERDLPDRLRRFRPDVVGTSSYISGVNEAKKVCRAAKRHDPACRTVVGGVHASQVPEDFADPAVDCIVLGDGTSVIGEVVRAMGSGGAGPHATA
jgi:hopanoid C-3 methylase